MRDLSNVLRASQKLNGTQVILGETNRQRLDLCRITFEYGDERNKVRIDNANSEKDAMRSAIVKARLLGFPYLENSSIKVKASAYQKKQNS